jgi:DHA1 family tetracycline resistance protein-like MFS transporter
LLSRVTPETEQGAVFGTFSSAQTLARMISYSSSNVMLGRISTAAPYWCAFGIDLVALAVAGRVAASRGPDTTSADEHADAPGLHEELKR